MKINCTLIVLLLLVFGRSAAQCPPNVGFEDVSSPYSNWTYYTGTVTAPASTYTWNWGAGSYGVPTATYHTLTTTGTDPFGFFPTVAPGAGAHSLLLNGPSSGRRASKASYTFTVPSSTTTFSMMYYYAVVLQDPGHDLWEQPRFEVSAFDITDSHSVPCADFTFISSSLAGAGFTRSTTSDGTDAAGHPTYNAWYLPWQAGSFNLTGYAGKTIRVDFQVGDCTIGGHWGYAYIDMDCGTFPDTVRICCPATITLPTAPPGFWHYDWWNVTAGWSWLGNTNPISYTCTGPTAPQKIAVVMTPYSGFGCMDTLYFYIKQDAPPVAGAIAGPSTICAGDITAYTNPTGTPGGTWSIVSTFPTGMACSIDASTGILTTDPSTPGTINIRYTLSNSCDSVFVNYTVAVKPKPDFSFVGPWCVNSGSAFTVNAVAITGCGGGCTFDWNSTGPSTSTSYTHPPLVIPCGHGTSITFPLTVTNGMCSTTRYFSTSVMPLANAGTISGPSSVVCDGDDILLSDAGYCGELTWTITGGDGSLTSTSDPGQVWVHCGSSFCTGTTITVKVTAFNGCTSTDVATYTIIVRPRPDFTVDGPSCVCSGHPFSVNLAGLCGCTGGCDYYWDWGGVLTSVPSYTHPGITIPCGQPKSITFPVTVTNSYGCSNKGNFSTTINPPAIIGTISGAPGIVCAGDDIPLKDIGYCGTLTWEIVSGDATLTSTSDPGTVIFHSTACRPELVTVRVRVTNGCCGSDSVDYNVSVNPRPVVRFIMPSCKQLCPGTDVQIAVTATPNATIYYNYTWPGCATVTDSLIIPSLTPIPPCLAMMTLIIPHPSALVPPCADAEGTFVFNLLHVDYGPCTTTYDIASAMTIAYPTATLSIPAQPCEGSYYCVDVTGTPGARVFLGPEALACDGTNWPDYVDLPVSGPSEGHARICSLIIPYWSMGMNTFCISEIRPETGCGTCNVYFAESYIDGQHHPLPCLNIISKPVPAIELLSAGPYCVGGSATLTTNIWNSGEIVTHPNTVEWSKDGTVIGLSSPSPIWTTGPPLTTFIEDALTEPVLLTSTAAHTYSVKVTGNNGCVAIASTTFGAGPAPEPISGPSAICPLSETPIVLSDVMPGGTWSCSIPTPYVTLAPSGSSVLVTDVSALSGTAVVTYTMPGNCYVTKNVHINLIPPIFGDQYLCTLGLYEHLYTPHPLITYLPPIDVTGGTWSGGPASVIGVTPTGIVTSVGVGTGIVTYTMPASKGGCYNTMDMTVLNGLPPITGLKHACGIGYTLDLANAVPGGKWTSSDESIATVNTEGKVTFTGLGTVTIWYCMNPQYGSTLFPPEVYENCCAEYVVSDIFPVTCNTDLGMGGLWNFSLSTPMLPTFSPGETFTMNYKETISGVAPCGGVGPGADVTATTVSYSGPGPALLDFAALYGLTSCEITGISDVEITIDGCPTFTVGCSFIPSKPGHTVSGAAAEEPGSLSLIPNPNKGIFTLRGALPDAGTAKSVTIHVVDMLGQVVLTDVADISNGNIDKSLTMDEKIANGMYMVRITAEGVNEVIKFTLQQ